MRTFWPFLYAANPDLDYRTVVAPDFLVHGKSVSLLRQNLEPKIDQRTEGEIRSTHLNANGIGPVSLFYRSVFVKESGEDVLDNSGRSIARVNGIVFRGLKDKSGFGLGEIETLIDQAEASLDDKFREFWSKTSGCPAIPSSSMQVGDGEPSPTPKQKRLVWKYFFAGALTVVFVEAVFLTAYILMGDQEPSLIELQGDIENIKEIVEAILEKME